jgi:diguanylate cyclase (GGDEF)-like protein
MFGWVSNAPAPDGADTKRAPARPRVARAAFSPVTVAFVLLAFAALVYAALAPESRAVRITLVVASSALLVGAWAHWLRLLRPLRRLAGSARRIKLGEDLLRVTSEGDGDVRATAEAMNAVLGRLTEARAALVDGDIESRHLRREAELKEELQTTNDALLKRVRDLDILYGTSSALGGSLELTAILDEMCLTVGRQMPDVEIVVFLLDPEREVLTVSAAHGMTPAERKRVSEVTFTEDEGVVGRVLRTGKQAVVDDVGTDPDWTGYKGRRSSFRGGFAAFPLTYGERGLGVLTFSRPTPFSRESVSLCQAVSNLVAVAVQNARLYERTLMLATRDELTRLYNRRHLLVALDNEWERARRFGDPLSVILMDIDRFKDINDAHGHLGGDEVLRRIGAVLEGAVRRTDTVGRYGGEEFIVVLPGTDAEQATGVAEKIRRAVEDTDMSVLETVTLSAGVACTRSDVGDRAADLLAAADSMLYRAKRQGRNRVLTYGRG